MTISPLRRLAAGATAALLALTLAAAPALADDDGDAKGAKPESAEKEKGDKPEGGRAEGKKDAPGQKKKAEQQKKAKKAKKAKTAKKAKKAKRQHARASQR